MDEYSSGRVIRTHGAEAQPQVLRWFFVGWAASLRFLSGGAKVKIHDESNVSLIADFFDISSASAFQLWRRDGCRHLPQVIGPEGLAFCASAFQRGCLFWFCVDAHTGWRQLLCFVIVSWFFIV